MQRRASAQKKREVEQQAAVLSFRACPEQLPAPEIPFPPTIAKSTKKEAARNRRNPLEVLLRRINNTVPFYDRPDLSSFVNWKGNAEAPIHRWLRYREAYSPHLITKLALGKRVLGPVLRLRLDFDWCSRKWIHICRNRHQPPRRICRPGKINASAAAPPLDHPEVCERVAHDYRLRNTLASTRSVYIHQSFRARDPGYTPANQVADRIPICRR